MGKIKVLAGDFVKGGHSSFGHGIFSMAKDEMGWTGYKTDTISAAEVDDLDKADETSVKRVWGTLAGGAVGAAVLGPLGLLAGVLVGGRGKDVTFVCKFKDGRKFMGQTDSKTYRSILGAVMDSSARC